MFTGTGKPGLMVGWGGGTFVTETTQNISVKHVRGLKGWELQPSKPSYLSSALVLQVSAHICYKVVFLCMF